MRVHSECLTGDVFGSMRCDCGLQLDLAMEHDRRGGRGRRRVPARPRGPRHRPRPQDPRVHAAGPGPRHRRGQRGARLPRRLPRVRHRLADPRRPRRHHDAAHDEQSGQVRRPRGLRSRDRRAGAAARACPTHENIRYLRTKQEKLGHLLEHRRGRARRRAGNAARGSMATHGEYTEYEGDARRDGHARRDRRGSLQRPRHQAAARRRARRRSHDLGLDDVPGVLGAGRVRDPAGRAAARGVAAVRRGDLPRRGDPGRHAALRLRGGGVRGRHRSGSRSTPASRACSACSPPTTSTRRSPAPAGRDGQQGRGGRAYRGRDGRACSVSSPCRHREEARDAAPRPAQGLARDARRSSCSTTPTSPCRAAPTSTTAARIDDPRVDEVRILRPQEIPQYVAEGRVRPRHHRARLDRGDATPTS